MFLVINWLNNCQSYGLIVFKNPLIIGTWVTQMTHMCIVLGPSLESFIQCALSNIIVYIHLLLNYLQGHSLPNLVFNKVINVSRTVRIWELSDLLIAQTGLNFRWKALNLKFFSWGIEYESSIAKYQYNVYIGTCSIYFYSKL